MRKEIFKATTSYCYNPRYPHLTEIRNYSKLSSMFMLYPTRNSKQDKAYFPWENAAVIRLEKSHIKVEDFRVLTNPNLSVFVRVKL